VAFHKAILKAPDQSWLRRVLDRGELHGRVLGTIDSPARFARLSS
jgi:hypothetical protein